MLKGRSSLVIDEISGHGKSKRLKVKKHRNMNKKGKLLFMCQCFHSIMPLRLGVCDCEVRWEMLQDAKCGSNFMYSSPLPQDSQHMCSMGLF